MSERPRWPIYALVGAAIFALIGRSRQKSAEKTGSSEPIPIPPPPVTRSGADPFDVLNVEAPKLGLDPRLVRAVMQAESGQKPFGPDGRVIIRFEPHVFARLTAEKALGLNRRGTRTEARAHGKIVLNPGMTDIYEGRKRKGGQAAEWETLGRARAIDNDLAIKSTSFGLGQIMGSNHKAAGYKTAQEMFDAFASSGTEQVLGMLRLITAVPALTTALKNKNLPAFVAVYNGAAVGTEHNNGYVKRMEAAFAKLS